MTTLLAQLEHQALANPGSIALRSGEESLTYTGLMSAVRRVAGREVETPLRTTPASS